MIWNALLQFPKSLWKRLRGSKADTSPQAHVHLASFMGRWYEQARYENPFEYGMDGVYTDYSAVSTGRFRVLNSGTDKKGKRHRAVGRGSLKDPNRPGALRVSFVPPYIWFSSPYHILYVDAHYREALVSGSGGHYLWLLTRDAHPDKQRIYRLLLEAQQRGFNTQELRATLHPLSD